MSKGEDTEAKTGDVNCQVTHVEPKKPKVPNPMGLCGSVRSAQPEMRAWLPGRLC